MSPLNLPNFLTLCRIVAIPIFLILLEELRFTDALIVFVAAGITDALDGAIARLTHTKTTLGAYLDPAADKALLVSSFIVLGFMHAVPRWLVVVVISRDVVLVLGYFLLFMLTQQTMAVRPSASGKLSTFLQLASVTVVLVGLAWPGTVRPVLAQLLFVLTGAVTTLAGLQYMYRGLAWFQGTGAAGAAPSRPGDGAADERRRVS